MADNQFITSPFVSPRAVAATDIATSDDLRIALGTRGLAKDGGTLVFCRTTANVIGNTDVVRITNDFTVDSMTSALSLRAGGAGVALHAFTTNQAGWVQLTGKAMVRTTGTIDPALPLYTSDTAGALSIVTCSLSGCLVQGLVSVTSASAGAHTTTAVFMNGMILRLAGSL